ncbi:MAG: peptidylprolyl isomerase [Polyangiaceae bacterium]
MTSATLVSSECSRKVPAPGPWARFAPRGARRTLAPWRRKLDCHTEKERPMSQVRASHILLMYKGSSRSTASRSKDEALQQITDLKSQVDSGADFADLARKHSDCPSSRSGGDLGSFGKGQMVKPFEDATYSMEVGQTSGIVETDFGYHLIQRTA